MERKLYAEINGEHWQSDYPFCGGCPELTIGIGCGHKGNGCAYPERRMERPVSHRSAFFALCKALDLSIETLSEKMGSCIDNRPNPEAIELINQHTTAQGMQARKQASSRCPF